MKSLVVLVCVLLPLCGFSQSSVLREVARTESKYLLKSAAKEAAEEATLKSIKVVTKDVLKSVPRGLKCLKVVKRADGGFEPVYKFLNPKKVKNAVAYNAKLMLHRRNAVAPYMQFPTLAQLGKINTKALKLGKKADAGVLRHNMFVAMGEKSANIVKGFGGSAAHHVIEGTDAAALKSRKILAKFKIDINSPENGIFLPTDNNSIFKGCLHRTSHTESYSKYVYDRIAKSKTREELIQTLNVIKHELYSGKLSLQGPAQIVNKNKLILN